MGDATCAQISGAWDGHGATRMGEKIFKINGISDSGDVTAPESCKSCRGLHVFLNKAPIAHKCKMQPRVSLSMAEG